jgi:hypothetical protein
MKRRVLAVCASLLLLSMVPGGALASTFTVDQSETTADASMGDAYLHAQTFTAGMYGPLVSVDLYLSGTSGTMTVSLQGVTGNPPAPDGTILGQKVLGVTAGSPAWTRFDFSAAPIVIPGHMYALFMFPIHVGIYGSLADTYAGGQSLMFYNGAWAPGPTVFHGSAADYDFKTNVGPAAATPTPTPAPTHVPTLAPTHTAAPAATTAASTAPSVSVSASASASVSALASAPSVSPSAAAAPTSSASSSITADPQSGGSSGFPIGIAVGGLLVLIAIGAGLVFLLWRRRQART